MLGLFGFGFVDFCDKFIRYDSSGEKVKSLFVVATSKETNGLVTVLEEYNHHNFEDGDYVTFREVEGMTEVNG